MPHTFNGLQQTGAKTITWYCILIHYSNIYILWNPQIQESTNMSIIIKSWNWVPMNEDFTVKGEARDLWTDSLTDHAPQYLDAIDCPVGVAEYLPGWRQAECDQEGRPVDRMESDSIQCTCNSTVTLVIVKTKIKLSFWVKKLIFRYWNFKAYMYNYNFLIFVQLWMWYRENRHLYSSLLPSMLLEGRNINKY